MSPVFSKVLFVSLFLGFLAGCAQYDSKRGVLELFNNPPEEEKENEDKEDNIAA